MSDTMKLSVNIAVKSGDYGGELYRFAQERTLNEHDLLEVQAKLQQAIGIVNEELSRSSFLKGALRDKQQHRLLLEAREAEAVPTDAIPTTPTEEEPA